MSRGRGEQLEPPAALTASSPARGKQNRLSRSRSLTPRSPRPDLRSPTRTHRTRVGGFSGESPHNDSDCQQDIVWDATSPSPCRLGKRGRRHPAPPNISEIVSRIAPKHGRPHVPEPTLLQWIGDSATIPCTPDLQAHRPRRKSPRASAVDDLLKLAKQFDLNMFHQEEEEEEQEELRAEFQTNVVSVNAAAAAAGSDLLDPLDQDMEDDLDFLFDGPTQRISGDLSQVSQPRPATAAAAPAAKHAGKTPTTNNKNNDEFEDDWENDDLLLNDSLVLEMTQNPLKFLAPPLCSTQAPPLRSTLAPPLSSPLAPPLCSTQAPPLRSTQAPPLRSAQAPPLRSAQAPPLRSAQAPPLRSAQAPPLRSAQAPPLRSAQAPPLRSAQAPPLRSAQAPPLRSTLAPPLRSAQAPPLRSAQAPPLRSAQAPPLRSAQAPPLCSAQAPPLRSAQAPPLRSAQAPPLRSAQAPPLRSAQAPPLCSAQAPPLRSAQAPPLWAGGGQSAAAKVKGDRATFRLDSNLSGNRTNVWTTTGGDAQVLTGQNPHVEPGQNQQPGQNPRLSGQRQQLDPRTRVCGQTHLDFLDEDLDAFFCDPGQNPRLSGQNPRPGPGTRGSGPTQLDFLDEDLDAFFCDPVWDDPADDALLCGMCEDLENQDQDQDQDQNLNLGQVSIKQTPPSGHRAVLQPTNQNQPSPLLIGSGGAAAGGVALLPPPSRPPQGGAARDRFTFKRPGNAVSTATSKDQFTFKKPENPVSTATNKAQGRCSAAEIELKKQQAVQRRRQRLQAQNVRAPR